MKLIHKCIKVIDNFLSTTDFIFIPSMKLESIEKRVIEVFASFLQMMRHCESYKTQSKLVFPPPLRRQDSADMNRRNWPGSGECFSWLSSLAPRFRLPNEQQGVLTDIEKIATNNHSPAMYLHSYPGTGKKIFGASLYRSQRWLNRGFVGYYSFSAGDMQRTTTTSLLGSLIHQILSSNPLNFDTVRDLYKAIEKRSIWNRHILWAMLKSLLSSLAHIIALHCKWSSQLDFT